MAKDKRPFPRFLYSNPTNTKSKGPFIVHTLEPKFIGKISKHSLLPDPDGNQVFSNREFNLTIVDGYISADDRPTVYRAFDWFELQIKSGEIQL